MRHGAVALLLAASLLAGCGNREGGSGVVLAPAANVVPDESASQATITPTALSFPLKGNEELLGKQPGAILVGGVGDGFIRKVVSIAVSGDQVVISTTEAALEEVIVKGAVDITPAPLPAAFARRSHQLLLSLDQYFQSGPIGVGFTDGSFQWSPSPTFKLEFDNGLKLLDVSLEGVASLSGAFKLAATASASEGGEVALGTPIVTRYAFLIGSVPVIATATLGAVIGYAASIDAQASIAKTVSGSGPLSAGIHYENGAWSTVGSEGLTFAPSTPSVEGKADLTASVYLKPSLGIDFYGVAGPRLLVKEAVTSTESVAKDACGSTVTLSVAASVEATASAEIHVLSRTIARSGDLTVYSKDFELGSMMFDGGTDPDCDGGTPDAGAADAGTTQYGQWVVSGSLVTDTVTGLDWDRVPGTSRHWLDAQSYCSSQGGRLATQAEMTALFQAGAADRTNFNLAIPQIGNNGNNEFWTSTLDAASSSSTVSNYFKCALNSFVFSGGRCTSLESDLFSGTECVR